MPDKILQADGSIAPVVAILGSGAAGSTDQTSTNALAVVNATLTPKGYQQVTSTGTAFALAPPAGSRIALIQAEAQALRWRDDGTAPTTTVGMLLNAPNSVEYDGNLSALRFIAATAGAILNVTYYA
ncbi:hypothetical protein [Burkholderia gladioli]|uniref:hypothetical protein n=1 Tax=Burkholderia gladioli TaxID=28095 RepID=UPI00163E1512|nr:hypothetical protein [Burkholderia gladioli]